MRGVGFALLSVCCAALAACQSTRADMGRGALQVRAGLGDAVTAPLEDLNLKRKHIPPVLLRAESDPYSLDGMQRCEAIAAEVGKLDEALGPDMDEPPPPRRTRGQTVADESADITLSAIRNATTDVIPMRGWVRRLTGAQRHSRHVQNAIRAGMMRRAYLKGVGMQQDCHPPAAPRWFVPTEDRRQASRGSRTAPLRSR